MLATSLGENPAAGGLRWMRSVLDTEVRASGPMAMVLEPQGDPESRVLGSSFRAWWAGFGLKVEGLGLRGQSVRNGAHGATAAPDTGHLTWTGASPGPDASPSRMRRRVEKGWEVRSYTYLYKSGPAPSVPYTLDPEPWTLRPGAGRAVPLRPQPRPDRRGHLRQRAVPDQRRRVRLLQVGAP